MQTNGSFGEVYCGRTYSLLCVRSYNGRLETFQKTFVAGKNYGYGHLESSDDKLLTYYMKDDAGEFVLANVPIGVFAPSTTDSTSHYYGDEGRWIPYSDAELAIVDMTDDHISNAILWLRRAIDIWIKRQVYDYARWGHLVYKCIELKEEAFKRGLVVNLDKEPPTPDETDHLPKKRV